MEKPKTCFLVDDDPDDLEFFKDAVHSIDTSLTCYTASDSESARIFLDKITVSPDLIFLDLNLPRVSGKEFLNQLKSHVLFKKIPVIIYSTSSNLKEKEESLALGAVDFLSKPCTVAGLKNMLTDVFWLHQLISPKLYHQLMNLRI